MPRGLRVARQTMALTFGAASSDRVDCGAAANLNTQNPCSFVAWFYPTSLVANNGLIGKGIVGQSTQITVRTTGDVEYFRNRATTNAQYRTTGLGILVNTWNFIGATFDGTVAPAIRIYRGLLATPAYEGAYTIATDGSGAAKDDSGGNLMLGNLHTTANAIVGRVALVAMFNRVLSLAEIQAWQYGGFDEPVSAPMAGCVGLWYPGKAGVGLQVLDYSNRGNNGTVTGATTNLGPPIPALPPLGDYRPRYGSPAGAAASAAYAAYYQQYYKSVVAA